MKENPKNIILSKLKTLEMNDTNYNKIILFAKKELLWTEEQILIEGKISYLKWSVLISSILFFTSFFPINLNHTYFVVFSLLFFVASLFWTFIVSFANKDDEPHFKGVLFPNKFFKRYYFENQEKLNKNFNLQIQELEKNYLTQGK